jgi:hypothetical protein
LEDRLKSTLTQFTFMLSFFGPFLEWNAEVCEPEHFSVILVLI